MPRMAATSAAVQHLREESARVDRCVALITRAPPLDGAALFQSSCDCTNLSAAAPRLWITSAQSRVTRSAKDRVLRRVGPCSLCGWVPARDDAIEGVADDRVV